MVQFDSAKLKRAGEEALSSCRISTGQLWEAGDFAGHAFEALQFGASHVEVLDLVARSSRLLKAYIEDLEDVPGYMEKPLYDALAFLEVPRVQLSEAAALDPESRQSYAADLSDAQDRLRILAAVDTVDCLIQFES